MYSPSISPIRRMRSSGRKSQARQPEFSPLHYSSNLPSRRSTLVASPQMTGDYPFLKKTVDERRMALRDSRSALANALDRLGEHHAKHKEYDDAMDAYTEALHEKRSVFSQIVASSFLADVGNRPRENLGDANSGEEREIQVVRNETIDSIVQTLRNMGNVHSLRGEQDEAMRYYTEVTSLRATLTGVREAKSVESFSKSSFYATDEDNSTLMSEINEDVKALDDLFRGISFRNAEVNDEHSAASDSRPRSPSVSSNATPMSADSTRKRRRGEALRENGSCENEPFKRASNCGSRSNNELTEALDAYSQAIDEYDIDQAYNAEQLNSFSLRAELLQENQKRSEKHDVFPAASQDSCRTAELQLALEVYRQVVSLQRGGNVSPTDDEGIKSANIASTLIRMGSLCYKLNNVAEELEMYREAKEVYSSAFGETHVYVAGTLKNIGMVLAERGEYESSMEQFEKARQIYLAVNNGDETNRDVASAISCMGNVRNRMGELEEALKHYFHALRIHQTVHLRETSDDSVRDVTATLKIIGMVYSKQGELDTAMNYFEQAMTMLRSSEAANSKAGKETMTSVSSRIAGIHFKKGEYDLAMKNYKEAHDLTVESKGANHPEVAGILHYIGGIHHKHQDYEEAMASYQEAVRIYHNTLGPGHPAVAATLVCIGSLHYKRRNLDSAMMFYREALRLNRDAYGLHHPDVAPTLKSIGTILTKKGDYDEAYQVFRDVLSIKCTVHGTGHPEVANAYKSLGNIHYKRGELADAERQYRHALNIYRRTRGEEHAETISARTSIEHIRYWMKERGQRDMEHRQSKSSSRPSRDRRCYSNMES